MITFVYAIGTEDGPIKVGITHNLSSRLRALQTGSAHKLEVIWVYAAYDRGAALSIEREYHERNADARLEGEWFDCPADVVRSDLNLFLMYALDPYNRVWVAERVAAINHKLGGEA